MAALNASRDRYGWWGLGAILGGILAFVVHSFVGTFVFGIFIYYATRPIYQRLKRRIRPRSLAAIVSLLVVAMPAISLLAYTLTIGVREFQRFSDTYDVGQFGGFVGPYVDLSRLTLTPEEIADQGGLDAIAESLELATQYLGVIGTGLLHLFVMVAIAFYLLRDGHRLSRWIRKRFSDDAGVLEAYLSAVDRSFHQVFFGNILNAVMTGVIGALSYNALELVAPSAIGLPYPTLLGLLAGLASLIPIVGMKLVYVPAAIYLFAAAFMADQTGLTWYPTAFVLVSFVIVDSIPDLVLRPYVSGRNLHVGMIMLAYIFGPLLFGWYGLFLAPMILVLAVHFGRIVLPELVAGQAIRPMAIDPGNVENPQSGPVTESDGESDRGTDGDATAGEESGA